MWETWRVCSILAGSCLAYSDLDNSDTTGRARRVGQPHTDEIGQIF